MEIDLCISSASTRGERHKKVDRQRLTLGSGADRAMMFTSSRLAMRVCIFGLHETRRKMHAMTGIM